MLVGRLSAGSTTTTRCVRNVRSAMFYRSSAATPRTPPTHCSHKRTTPRYHDHQMAELNVFRRIKVDSAQ